MPEPDDLTAVAAAAGPGISVRAGPPVAVAAGATRAARDHVGPISAERPHPGAANPPGPAVRQGPAAASMSPWMASGIVLAGGRSSRFGVDKLAVEVDGRPLLHRAIVAVAGVVDEVVVVIAADGARPRLPTDLAVPVRVVRDAAPGRGPLAGLAAGLAAARAPLALLVGGDQPSLAPTLLAELLLWLDADADPPLDVVALEDEGALRPLPSALRVATVRAAAAYALDGGTRSLLGLFERLHVGAVAGDRWRELDPGGGSLRDVDTPDDLGAG